MELRKTQSLQYVTGDGRLQLLAQDTCVDCRKMVRKAPESVGRRVEDKDFAHQSFSCRLVGAQADPIRQHHRPVVEPHRIDIVAVSAGRPLDRPWLARHGAQQIVGPIGNHEDYAIWRCWWSRKIEPESMEMSHIWDVECGQSDHGT